MAQLLGQKVVLLRSPETSGQDRYTEILQEAGCVVYNVPTLDFQYQNLDSLKEQLDSASSFSGIVFTSPRAVIATSEAIGGQLDPAWLSKPCFVVGERTCALVEEKLGLSPVGSESGNAANLADMIAAKMVGENMPLLFPAGNLKKETLPTKLKNAGIPLLSCTVYVTCQHPDMATKLKECIELKPDFIVYFSPSGVSFSQEIMTLTGCLDQVKHVPIGPTTRDALEKNDIKVFGTAVKPCPESVLEIIKS